MLVLGIRESELKEKLESERDEITKDIRKFNVQIEPSLKQEVKASDVDEKSNEDINACVDLALRDQIMEIEEKIFFGTLGTLKIRDRQAWQKAIQVISLKILKSFLDREAQALIVTFFSSPVETCPFLP